jgi:glycosyltransferase involved in cell wall biosynthesis
VKISVIIPVKNRATLLAITLDNILGQSLRPYEIIVVDDGSTDEIEQVINKFKTQVIFTQSNGKGPGGARNVGLKIATGNVIQFFDSDDLMTTNKLQVQSEVLQSQKADFVYGPNVKAVLDNGVWKQADVIMQYYPLPNRHLADMVMEGWCAITQSAMFTRDLVDEVGPWREDLMTHEDYEYWFRVGKIAKKFCHENESCVIYRQHQNQVTDQAVTNQKRWMEGLHAMQHIEQGADHNPSLASLMLFKGRFGSSKLGYTNLFGPAPGLDLKLDEKLMIPYFKIKAKLGNRATGTAWQKIHGPNPSPAIFDKFIKML